MKQARTRKRALQSGCVNMSDRDLDAIVEIAMDVMRFRARMSYPTPRLVVCVHQHVQCPMGCRPSPLNEVALSGIHRQEMSTLEFP